MNLVGPFAKAQINAQMFATSLLFSSSCTETMKALNAMAKENKALTEKGDKAALTLNKLDENIFLEMMFSAPIVKDA